MGEVEIRRIEDRVDLAGAAKADDRAVDGRIGQRPSDGDGADARVVAVGHRAEPLDEREVLGEAGLLEARVALAPVVVRERGEALAGHCPGEQPGAHRRVDDDPDPFALCEGEDLVFGVAGDQRVGRLQRLDRCDLLDAAELLGVEVGDSDVADEAVLFELDERRPALLDLLVGDWPVDLVEVDRVEPEPCEAPLELAPEGVAPQALDRVAPQPSGCPPFVNT